MKLFFLYQKVRNLINLDMFKEIFMLGKVACLQTIFVYEKTYHKISYKSRLFQFKLFLRLHKKIK